VVEAAAQFEEVKIPLPEPVHELEAVTGILGIPEWWPTGSRVSVVLAQGQRSDDALLQALQRHLTERRCLTLRFGFPFLEAGKRKPDPMPVLQRTYASALATLSRDPTAAPAHVFIGGQNLGALATAHAATARVRVEGLFFLGYPLHKQDDPSDVRAERLFRIVNPMLFVQGSRDRHCVLPTLRRTLARVGAPVQLHVVEEADHTLHVAKKSGRTPDEVRAEVAAILEAWIAKVLDE
jgi:uncharacterized protein